MPEVPATADPAQAAASATGPAFSPLYQQIKALLLNSLQSAEWRPGELIPSEFDLAARYKVSQGTVRKAIDELAAENLLVRRQGKGTFVATHSAQHIQYRFLRLQSDSGAPAALQRRFIDCRRLKAPAAIARDLQLKPPADAVLQITRLLLDGLRPVVLDDIWLPALQFKGLSAERLSQYPGPMYALFEAEFSVRMIRAQEQIRAVNADADTAATLGVAPGSALLSVERLSFTYGDKPVEVRRGLYSTTSHHYRNELN
jgi:GntR family transcriptional regulator